MSANSEPITSIQVLMADELAGLAESSRRGEIEQRIIEGVSDLLQRLGIPGKAVATVRSGAHGRAVRVVVNRIPLPFPPSLLTRVWHTAAPYDFHNAPLEDAPAGTGFRDGWLRNVGARLESDATIDSVLSRFVADVAVTVIRESPECLLSDDHVASIARTASRSRASDAQPTSTDLMGLVRFLVSLGVSVSDRTRLLEAGADTLSVDLPPEDHWETAFERLRPPRIEIHVPHDYLASLRLKRRRRLPVYDDALDRSLQDPFRDLEQSVFFRLGLRLPKLVWVADGGLDPGTVAIVVNDLPALPVRIPKADQLLADVSAASLPSSISGQESYLPTSGIPATLVPALHREELEREGAQLWTSIEAVAAVVGGEVTRRAPALLAVEDVTSQLWVLAARFPTLVEAALAVFSLGDLTRVLRGLLAERVSVRDLRLVLDRLLDYEAEAVLVDYQDEILLDRRMAVPRDAATPVDGWEFLLAFVRTGLTDDLADQYADERGRLDALLLDPEFEEHAARSSPTRNGSVGLDPETAGELRDAVWGKLPTGPSPRREPVVLTSALARRAVRDSLASELPDLAVLAHAEVKPSLKVRRLGTIGVPRTGR